MLSFCFVLKPKRTGLSLSAFKNTGFLLWEVVNSLLLNNLKFISGFSKLLILYTHGESSIKTKLLLSFSCIIRNSFKVRGMQTSRCAVTLFRRQGDSIYSRCCCGVGLCAHPDRQELDDPLVVQLSL